MGAVGKQTLRVALGADVGNMNIVRFYTASKKEDTVRLAEIELPVAAVLLFVIVREDLLKFLCRESLPD